MPGEKQRDQTKPRESTDQRPERNWEQRNPREGQETGKTQRRSEETTRKQ